MARPKKPRRISWSPGAYYFKPRAVPLRDLAEVVLSIDELEALRLCDLEGKDQTAAAEEMAVSQSTLQRILARARKKIAEALIKGKAIKIEENENSF